VIWYTAQFQAMYFLQNSLRIDDSAARIIIGLGAAVSLLWFIFFGWVSDRVGRKKPIVVGYALLLIVLFPLFHWAAAVANPALAAAVDRAPVVVTGSDCRYNPFATRQATACGQVLDALSRTGVAYTKVQGPQGAPVNVTIGGQMVLDTDRDGLETALVAAGYPLDKIVPTLGSGAKLVLVIVVIGMLSGMTYGPVAALLSELFPAKIRYTSMSIPYHIGTGYFGGLLPFTSQYIVARTGDPFSGLWYTFVVVAVALVVTVLWLPETLRKEDRLGAR